MNGSGSCRCVLTSFRREELSRNAALVVVARASESRRKIRESSMSSFVVCICTQGEEASLSDVEMKLIELDINIYTIISYIVR